MKKLRDQYYVPSILGRNLGVEPKENNTVLEKSSFAFVKRKMNKR